jgi:hypothetical protein
MNEENKNLVSTEQVREAMLARVEQLSDAELDQVAGGGASLSVTVNQGSTGKPTVSGTLTITFGK